MFAIVSNEVINIVSDYQHADDIDEYAEILADEDFIEKIDAKESYDSIVKLIKQMDEKYSISLMYYYCHDMDVNQIAKMLGLSEKTIYTRLMRGKLILLKTIKEGSYHG